MILYRKTTKLFYEKYQYKITLVFFGASAFRQSDADKILNYLNYHTDRCDQAVTQHVWQSTPRADTQRDNIKTAMQVLNHLTTMKDFKVRVEGNWLSIYSNNIEDISQLKNIDIRSVESIFEPTVALTPDTVVSSLPYDYKVFISPTTTNIGFVKWAESNVNVRLTRTSNISLSYNHDSCRRTYCYIKGDNTLLMAKIHLGSTIQKIYRIIKA